MADGIVNLTKFAEIFRREWGGWSVSAKKMDVIGSRERLHRTGPGRTEADLHRPLTFAIPGRNVVRGVLPIMAIGGWLNFGCRSLADHLSATEPKLVHFAEFDLKSTHIAGPK
jgi:hypothetical protein